MTCLIHINLSNMMRISLIACVRMFAWLIGRDYLRARGNPIP